uniref:guanylate cyclase n=1 Tax=Parastrongyloides trichosuri TaxID=131310 RepID=A0A0N4ZZF7_PARTI
MINAITTIKIGFLFTQKDPYYDSNVGFLQSAGVVPLAFKEVIKNQLLPNINFSIFWRFDNCIESLAAGESYILGSQMNVSVIFGPSCVPSVIRSSLVAQSYNTPLFIWGFIGSSEMLDHKRLPNVISIYATFYSVAYATIDVLQTFNWTTFTYIVAAAENNRCYRMFKDFIAVINLHYPESNMKYSTITSNPPTQYDYDIFLNTTKTQARIIISCFDYDEWKRDFLLAMYDHGFTNNEWVHINMDLKKLGFSSINFDSEDKPLPFYVDSYNKNDNRDNDALKMAKKMLSIDSISEGKVTNNFTNEVLKAIKGWPFYCESCNTTGITQLATYSTFLYDAIYAWAELMNSSMTKFGEDAVLSNYSLLKSGCNGTLKGFSGSFKYDENCVKLPFLQLRGLNENGVETVYVNYSFTALFAFNKLDIFTDYATSIFQNWNNKIPLNQPVCGYKGLSCPLNIFKDYLVIAVIAIVIIALVVIFLVICIIYSICRVRKNTIEGLSRWKIPFARLERPKHDNNDINQSLYSFQSGRTSKSSKATLNSKQDSRRFIYLYYNGESVVGEKHNVTFQDKKEIWKELTEILSVEHQNVNKFFGMSIDGNIPLSVWRYCRRGSLFGPPWDLENRDDSIQELIYLIKRGSYPPIRPDIEPYQGLDINPAVIALIKDCWNEKPDERPKINQIKKIIKTFSDKKSKNLMDHIFNILEDYAQTLKEDVDYRTKEVVEEQKKIDVLLNKMLPAAVAGKLKLGKVVEPEDFDSVTIFFADVVKFTTLSSKCSPMQVITLVNDLYTMFDNIIESLDIYKVETIGDGYLCVSGLPLRNGIRHGREIAMLALGFMDACNNFKIPHLPNERIMLRIGCNSGPCVAGVVGLSMPRYCLFGDTVNTASRMESNGKPGRIHITEDCYNLLCQIGGFTFECRGEVIIKGKGVMITYWLNGVTDNKPKYVPMVEKEVEESDDLIGSMCNLVHNNRRVSHHHV